MKVTVQLEITASDGPIPTVEQLRARLVEELRYYDRIEISSIREEGVEATNDRTEW